MIHQPARSGHHDLGQLLQLRDLLVDGLSSVETGHPHPFLEGAQVPQLVLNLKGQLTGGSQHQGLELTVRRVNVLHHGDAEGKGFACSGRGFGDDVLPLHEAGNGPHLNGGGLDVSLLFDSLHDLGGEPQLGVLRPVVYLLSVDLHNITPFLSV